MVNYVAIQLVPAMLSGAGFDQPSASRGLTMVNIGGVVGAVMGALIIQRLGSRITMLGMSAIAVVCSLVMSQIPLNPMDTFNLMAMFLITGGLLNAVQTTMYALAAHVYPTEIRSTGVGAAVAFGRVGNVLAVYVGNYALNLGGSPAYFTSWAILMALVFLSLAIIGRHVPKSAIAGAPATASTH
jgi:AAHS family 4-hydroxybenzoate transporter-like MFS transporter